MHYVLLFIILAAHTYTRHSVLSAASGISHVECPSTARGTLPKYFSYLGQVLPRGELVTLVGCLAPETSRVWVSDLHTAGRFLNFSQVPELNYPHGEVCILSRVTFSSQYFSYLDG